MRLSDVADVARPGNQAVAFLESLAAIFNRFLRRSRALRFTIFLNCCPIRPSVVSKSPRASQARGRCEKEPIDYIYKYELLTIFINIVKYLNKTGL